jgi:hypothetical protein
MNDREYTTESEPAGANMAHSTALRRFRSLAAARGISVRDPTDLGGLAGTSETVSIKGTSLDCAGIAILPNTTDKIVRSSGNTADAHNPSPFMSLPAELRLIMYAFVFTSDDNQNGTDLLDPHPPPQDLLSTCIQVYKEAATIYKDACQTYWSSTTFIIKNSRSALNSLDTKAARLPHQRFISLIPRVWLSGAKLKNSGTPFSMLLEGVLWTFSIWSQPHPPGNYYHFEDDYYVPAFNSTPAVRVALEDRGLEGDPIIRGAVRDWDERVQQWRIRDELTWYFLDPELVRRYPELGGLMPWMHLTQEGIVCALGMMANRISCQFDTLGRVVARAASET